MRLGILIALSTTTIGLTACNGQPGRAELDADEAELHSNYAAENPQQVWWDRLQGLCGQAFSGEMVRFDRDMDTGWLNVDVTMHVRECSADEIRIPLHVGENRSRTWVLTRTEDGIRLKHDHRHPDGSEDTMTQYGGHTVDEGSEYRQEFPAGEFSRTLFEAQDHPDGVHNRWAMEVHPGERFSYELTRPGRHFQADFDLANPVAAPPPPWAVEPAGAAGGEREDA